MPTPTRRRVLQASAASLATGALADGAAAAPPPDERKLPPLVYQSLGVKPVINAVGTVTALGGSVMPPEVAEAWAEASRESHRGRYGAMAASIAAALSAPAERESGGSGPCPPARKKTSRRRLVQSSR